MVSGIKEVHDPAWFNPHARLCGEMTLKMICTQKLQVMMTQKLKTWIGILLHADSCWHALQLHNKQTQNGIKKKHCEPHSKWLPCFWKEYSYYLLRVQLAAGVFYIITKQWHSEQLIKIYFRSSLQLYNENYNFLSSTFPSDPVKFLYVFRYSGLSQSSFSQCCSITQITSLWRTTT